MWTEEPKERQLRVFSGIDASPENSQGEKERKKGAGYKGHPGRPFVLYLHSSARKEAGVCISAVYIGPTLGCFLLYIARPMLSKHGSTYISLLQRIRDCGKRPNYVLLRCFFFFSLLRNISSTYHAGFFFGRYQSGMRKGSRYGLL